MSLLFSILSAFVWPVAHAFNLFVYFLAFLTVYRAHLNGNLAKAAPLVRALCWVIVGIGYVADVSFNWTVAWVLGVPRHDTFTRRCSSLLATPGWRGATCRFICDQLDLFQEGGHCKRPNS